MKSPLELNHVWPENYSVNSAQKVWGAVFAAHHPNVVVLDLSSLQVRSRRADLRAHRLDHREVEDALRGAPRHRREQAGRLDQDPREDVHPRAEASTRSASRTRARRSTSSSTRSTRSASSSSSSRRSRRATRACRTRSSSRRSRRSARSSRRTCRTPAARMEPEPAPKGIVKLGKKTQGRDDRPGQRTIQRCYQRR